MIIKAKTETDYFRIIAESDGNLENPKLQTLIKAEISKMLMNLLPLEQHKALSDEETLFYIDKIKDAETKKIYNLATLIKGNPELKTLIKELPIVDSEEEPRVTSYCTMIISANSEREV